MNTNISKSTEGGTTHNQNTTNHTFSQRPCSGVNTVLLFRVVELSARAMAYSTVRIPADYCIAAIRCDSWGASCSVLAVLIGVLGALVQEFQDGSPLRE